ncbi:peptidoglycan DD-metalloendopeptidase family protein [Pseudomonas sp. S 311-6]|uniref:Lipoprotein NlpD n=1 Tax=Kerstersia gyiorum TaxID=206506 RepID=A0A171KT69_9BURK|nr:peptidoglycan DD-metalloendopeptidase family protein [Kerstersia gyiorum]MCO7639566.1 peptidoglycan DD-metalloendopeptidase family protein [Pseudomonas sp. S 311-6]KAB0543052.1 peptidoglycan DD-metalloendopeptidase family protein [Kerstersia gyiorum]KKO72086.1 peptidase [Kerstersia gyiorum]MCR4159672.1 peptidoglycan DD-metalloendopeptidase family protein [Kerstersia gyiorum]QBR40763.1 LysM peptidoglycan-binding domain-containing protein [Kerstersia gyiorum]
MTNLSSTRNFRLPVLAAALVLAGCASQQPAPIVDGAAARPAAVDTPAPSAGIPGASYTVQPRDTLYQIARSNNVSVEDLRRWNNITDPTQLRIGQVLRLSPAGSAVAGGAASTGTGSTQVAAIADPKPVAVQTPKPVETPAATPATAKPGSTTAPDEKSVVRAADANLIDWGWPSNGKLIQGFNSNTKGIDIDGQPGDPVAAAAAGQVMYSGNGVRGLGNLIIINHTGGFITAYAHNRKLLVKTGDKVTRGQRIAELGQTDTTSPRLHFEVRRQGTPVDPLKYLPHR